MRVLWQAIGFLSFVLLVLFPGFLFAAGPYSSHVSDTRFVPAHSLGFGPRAEPPPFGAALPQTDSTPPFPINDNPPDTYDLLQYQTAVKDQNPRGSCETFAFIGAIEALYKRKYGFELNLSEEYFIHIVFSTLHTNNPAAQHENPAVFCETQGLADGKQDGRPYLVMPLPKEMYAPYFGNSHINLDRYGTLHGHSDLANIADQNGISKTCDHSQPLSQSSVDGFNFDPRYIPRDAAKHAIYGATEIVMMSWSKVRDTVLLEKIVASDKEVALGLALGKIDCGDATYYDGTPVAFHNGFPVCRYPVTPNTFCSQPNCSGIHEGYNSNGDYWQDGHAMVLVGYDRGKELFLFKNSWGNTLSYHWIPYQAIESRASDGEVVLSVRDPNLPPPAELMWMGRWTMDHDGWPGELIIRRPGKVPEITFEGDFILVSSPTFGNDRIGTYKDQGGDSHEVTGKVGTGTSLIWIHDQVEGPPDPPSQPVNLNGQKFFLRLFQPEDKPYLFGNFASGETEWSDFDFGVLLHRPEIDIKHTPGAFSLNLWKDGFKLYLQDGTSKNLSVTEIGPPNELLEYPVTFTYDKSKKSGYIRDVERHRLISSALPSDLFYHGHETGIISGLGGFGIRSSDMVVTGISASDGTYEDKVKITWDTLDSDSIYTIYYSTSLGGEKTILWSQHHGTSLNHTSGIPGKLYLYWVSGTGSDGDWTDLLFYDTGYRGLREISARDISVSKGAYTDKTHISWKRAEGALQYSVYRKASSKDLPFLIGTSRATELDDVTGVPGRTYTYQVQAEGEFALSDLSAPVKGYRKLAAPLELIATDGDREFQDRVSVNWSGVREADSYSVYRGDPKGRKPKVIGTTTETSFADSTGTPGQTYLYSVKANNEYGSSDFSASDPGHRVILPPQGVSASDGTYTDKVQITWAPVDGVTSYEVLRGDEPSSAFQLIGTVKGKTSYDDKTTEVGKVYSYHVKSKNAYGASAPSSPDSGFRGR